MSHPYWGTCYYCHRLMYFTEYPDEVVFWCPVHSYTQHFRRQPDAWSDFHREKFWRIVEVLPDFPDYREILTIRPCIENILQSIGLKPDDILKPRYQWDYFYWRDLVLHAMSRALTEPLWLSGPVDLQAELQGWIDAYPELSALHVSAYIRHQWACDAAHRAATWGDEEVFNDEV